MDDSSMWNPGDEEEGDGPDHAPYQDSPSNDDDEEEDGYEEEEDGNGTGRAGGDPAYASRGRVIAAGGTNPRRFKKSIVGRARRGESWDEFDKANGDGEFKLTEDVDDAFRGTRFARREGAGEMSGCCRCFLGVATLVAALALGYAAGKASQDARTYAEQSQAAIAAARARGEDPMALCVSHTRCHASRVGDAGIWDGKRGPVDMKCCPGADGVRWPCCEPATGSAVAPGSGGSASGAQAQQQGSQAASHQQGSTPAAAVPSPTPPPTKRPTNAMPTPRPTAAGAAPTTPAPSTEGPQAAPTEGPQASPTPAAVPTTAGPPTMHPTPLPLDLNNPYMQKIEDPKRVAFWKAQQEARFANSKELGTRYGSFKCGKKDKGLNCVDRTKKPYELVQPQETTECSCTGNDAYGSSHVWDNATAVQIPRMVLCQAQNKEKQAKFPLPKELEDVLTLGYDLKNPENSVEAPHFDGGGPSSELPFTPAKVRDHFLRLRAALADYYEGEDVLEQGIEPHPDDPDFAEMLQAVADQFSRAFVHRSAENAADAGAIVVGVLGDSTTASADNCNFDSWSNQLQRQLAPLVGAAGHVRFEVRNAGKNGGYNPDPQAACAADIVGHDVDFLLTSFPFVHMSAARSEELVRRAFTHRAGTHGGDMAHHHSGPIIPSMGSDGDATAYGRRLGGEQQNGRRTRGPPVPDWRKKYYRFGLHSGASASKVFKRCSANTKETRVPDGAGGTVTVGGSGWWPGLGKNHWGKHGDCLCHFDRTRSGSDAVWARNWHLGPSPKVPRNT